MTVAVASITLNQDVAPPVGAVQPAAVKEGCHTSRNPGIHGNRPIGTQQRGE